MKKHSIEAQRLLDELDAAAGHAGVQRARTVDTLGPVRSSQ